MAQDRFATLVQHTNGMFYGDTYAGGTYGFGVVYRLSDGANTICQVRISTELWQSWQRYPDLGGDVSQRDRSRLQRNPGELQREIRHIHDRDSSRESRNRVRDRGNVERQTHQQRAISRDPADHEFQSDLRSCRSFGDPNRGQFEADDKSHIQWCGGSVNQHHGEVEQRSDIKVPTGAKTGKIVITTEGRTAKSAANFAVS